MVRADRITTAALVLLILGYLVVAGRYPGNAKTIPLILGTVALSVAVVQLLAPVLPFLQPAVGNVDNEEGARMLSEPRLRRRFYAMTLSLVLVPISIALIGLVVTLPLYAALFTALDRQRPVFVVATTAAVGAASYGLLVVLIALPWNDGYFLGGFEGF